MTFRPILFIVALSILPLPAHAGADADWKGIQALDSGPKQKPASAEQASLFARNHFLLQRRALEDFLKLYPSDARAPQAKIRLADIYAAEGMMDNDPARVGQAVALFQKVASDPTASPTDRANAAFRKASLQMQTVPGGPEKNPESVAAIAEKFAAAFPADPRGARILVEAATVCDSHPETKRRLLEQAKAAASEESTKHRIADDFRRLDRLGKPLEFKAPGLDSGEVDLAASRGKPTLLVFWASQSPQSLLWLRDFRQSYDKLPKGSLNVVTFNMDENRGEAKQRFQALNANWPTAYEPGGWNAPTPRSLGINALPSVWFIDSEGILRSLNAKTSWKQLL